MDSTTPPPAPAPGPHSRSPHESSTYSQPQPRPAPYPGGPPPAGGPTDHGAPRPPRGAAFFDSLRRSGLAREQDRWIGGVASGIAARLGIDPLLVRGAFVVLALFGGAAIVAYGVLWALLPEARDGRIHLEAAVRGRFDGALAGAIAFVLVGMSRPTFWFESGQWLPDWVVAFAWLGLVTSVILVAVLATSGARRSRTGDLQQRVPTAPFDTPAGGATGTAPVGPGGAGTMNPAAAPGSATTAAEPTPYPAYAPPASRGQAPPSEPAMGSYRAYGTTAPPRPPYEPAPIAWQPPPRRPRSPGPGAATVAAAWALVLLAGAGVLIGHRLDVLSGSAALTIAGATIVLLGLGALVSGARGRRAGSLGVIAVLVAVFAVPAAVLSSELPDWRSTVGGDAPVIAGDVVWAPATVDEAASGYAYSVGEATIDLTGPDWRAERATARVLIEAGAGSTTVLVPSGVPLEIRTSVGLGEVRTTLRGDWERTSSVAGGTTGPGEPTASADDVVSRTEASGSALDVVLRSPARGDLALTITIDAALGDVIIEEDLR
jgi:phage shock protein PspC (stress-responsive transcriptional regulator)